MSETTKPIPPIQLRCNLVIRRGNGEILLVKTDADAVRWWLPWADLQPYQHPDEAVAKALKAMTGLTVRSSKMAQVQSFNGRTGWHVTFDYFVEVDGEGEMGAGSEWFAVDKMPKTAHGEWEKTLIKDVLAKSE